MRHFSETPILPIQTVHVGLALKDRADALPKASGTAPGEGITEDTFVIRTFRNGVGVFVFQLGLEGLVTFKRDVQFDTDNYAVVVPPLAGGAEPISVFDKVEVRIEVEKIRIRSADADDHDALEPC